MILLAIDTALGTSVAVVGDDVAVTLTFSNGSTLNVTAVARDIANYAG